MEDDGQIAPTELDRAPDVIRKSKFEIGKMDVLICGKCHIPFYHIEEFQKHRSEDKCRQESILRENEKIEPKEQIWAFTLWKNGILNSGKRTEPLTPWTLYKRWCALNESDKKAWVVAGQNLQTFTKLSLSRMHEMKGAIRKTKPNSMLPEKINKPMLNSDMLEEGELRLSQLTDVQKAAIKSQIAANKSNKENTTELKKIPIKLAQLYTELIKKPPELRKALRTGKNNVIEEATFEKVLSRRLNHKSKCLEYFVKWENMKESENTWEPRAHFEKCKQIMDQFDKVFNTSKVISKASDVSVESENELTLSRPPRSSKQKAKDQVKTWCDSMSDDEESFSKRKLFDDDSDSTDSFEKKIKMEEESDTSEDDRRVRRTKAMPASMNGLSKKPADTITPQRVVRVSQKHLPNLSTGVYIMSKTEGIIKLNSDTPLPSSSPLLKVGQRIGQTHVKMVKKDAPKSPIKILPKIVKADFSTSQAGQSAKINVPPFVESNETLEKNTADEDSDGISELDFPTDLPLPEPDSPPGDFVLDPLTGKIAGQEYPEESDEVEMASKQEPETEHETTSLDSLVKMAVSDLPDVDDVIEDKFSIAAKIANITQEALSTDSDIPTTILLDPIPISVKPEVQAVVKAEIQPVPSPSRAIAATDIDLESAITLTAIEKTPPVVKPRPKSESILNAALTNSKAPQKKLLSATPTTVRQKVMPRPQIHTPSPSVPIIHKVTHRPKAFPHRSALQDPIVRRSPNVNTYRPASSNMTRRIGNTTIYKTGSKPVTASQPVIKAQPVHKQQTVVSRMISTPPVPAPTVPISMPLIGIDDEPEVAVAAGVVEPPVAELLPALSNELPTINIADTEPLFITGDDGTIYQVAGQNEEGQTILISQGPDGQQQCVIVTTESAEEELPTQALLIPPEAVTQPQSQEQQQQHLDESGKMDIDESDDADSQVVAQIVKADPPSPGGTRKVVLMLPDGNLMMTEVTAEQYAALELDQ